MNNTKIDTFVGESIEINGSRQRSLADGWSQAHGGIDSYYDSADRRQELFSLVSAALDEDLSNPKSITSPHLTRLEENINGALD